MRLFFADKPAGLTTHTSLNESDKRKPWVNRADGFLEFLQARTKQTLFPVHRLDKDTTGAIAFALDRETAEVARAAFESRDVHKHYFFLTDRKCDETGFEVESIIERVGNEFISRAPRTGETANAKTQFTFLKSKGRFSLWSAHPETGKSHQIRLHAEAKGLPILGDHLHGGSDFPALCLHSREIKLRPDLNDGEGFISEPAPYYSDLSLLNDVTLCKWLAAIDRRERILKSLKETEPSTLRWIHSEGDPLRAESLGEVVSLNWFRESPPTETEWSSIHKLREIRGWKSWYLQIRGDRGRAPANEKLFLSEPPPPERWIASEHDLKFEFRRDSGLSPGLFLDQRENRAFVKSQAAGAERVLNLFCYTSGFSVAAAKGGAKHVISVDVSKTFLEWSKRNFEINGLPLENHEFRAMDAREYVAWAIKKQFQFDFVICDPPSFARGKKDLFRIEKDFDRLFLDCLTLVKPKAGKLLFSTNYEVWSTDDLGLRVQKAIQNSTFKTRIVEAPSPDLDFETPHSPRNMKCVLVERM